MTGFVERLEIENLSKLNTVYVRGCYTNEDINYDKIKKIVPFWVVRKLSLFLSRVCSRRKYQCHWQ